VAGEVERRAQPRPDGEQVRDRLIERVLRQPPIETNARQERQPLPRLPAVLQKQPGAHAPGARGEARLLDLGIATMAGLFVTKTGLARAAARVEVIDSTGDLGGIRVPYQARLNSDLGVVVTDCISAQ